MTISSHSKGFNSATVVTPWKRRRFSDSPRRNSGFNSATVVTPWKPAFRRLWGAVRACFNSATVVTPWKPDPVANAFKALVTLQFGHGCDAVETNGVLCFEEEEHRLQFGHGCDAVETGSVRHEWRGFRCFNSATVVTPWKRGRRCEGGGFTACFNSATVVTPWKPSVPVFVRLAD